MTRDDLIDKEVAEKLSKEVASYITEQIKSNMNTVTVKCRDLMVGDWITNRNGFPMQITNVGDDYAYATFKGNEGEPWEFDDKNDKPQPIPLTPEILEKNGWLNGPYSRLSLQDGKWLEFYWYEHRLQKYWEGIDEWQNHTKQLEIVFKAGCIFYVHELQHALRLCGLNELADNFKV